jgi:hypothetical protein
VSEHLLKILLSELETVRVACQKCSNGAAVELSVGSMHVALDKGRCRFCGAQIHAPALDPFNNLRIALDEIRKLQDVKVEFVLPEPKVQS